MVTITPTISPCAHATALLKTNYLTPHVTVTLRYQSLAYVCDVPQSPMLPQFFQYIKSKANQNSSVTHSISHAVLVQIRISFALKIPHWYPTIFVMVCDISPQSLSVPQFKQFWILTHFWIQSYSIWIPFSSHPLCSMVFCSFAIDHTMNDTHSSPYTCMVSGLPPIIQPFFLHCTFYFQLVWVCTSYKFPHVYSLCTFSIHHRASFGHYPQSLHLYRNFPCFIHFHFSWSLSLRHKISHNFVFSVH